MVARAGLLLTCALCIAAVGAPSASAASAARSCSPIVNPYEGTRYEGIDLRRIRATGVRCSKARRVVRRAHRKALGLPVPTSGVRRFTWRRWKVKGDIRRSTDRYGARRGSSKRVRWVF